MQQSITGDCQSESSPDTQIQSGYFGSDVNRQTSSNPDLHTKYALQKYMTVIITKPQSEQASTLNTRPQKPHNAIVIPINTGQITNTNRNLSFSTSTPFRPAFAARCPCPGTPPPGIVPDGGGTPEGVVDWPLESAVALVVVVVKVPDPAIVGTVLNPDSVPVPVPVPFPAPLCVANTTLPLPVPVPIPVTVPVVFAGTIAKSDE